VIKSFSITTFILLCFALLESAILSNMLFLPAVPDLMLICLLYVSIQNGRLYGVSSGFVSGIIIDFLSASPFGLNCLLRTTLGYISGLFNKTLNIDGFLTPITIGACATILKAGVLWLIAFLFPNVSAVYHIISKTFAAELIMNGLLTPVIFKFLNVFKNSIVLTPENVS
jgi:rod shape-determining protein MreD